MDLRKPDRIALKGYFVKNAVPTAGNFADLVDGMLNQKDDGIAKPAGEPLSLQADGDNTSQKKVLNLYRSFADPKVAWTLSLNPRSDPNNPGSARPGLSFGDGDGNSRLFIDQASGSVGIGTIAPSHRFHVVAPDAVGLFESSTAQAYLRLSTKEGLDNRVELANRAGGRLVLWTATGGDVLNITKDGKVGIGVTDPAGKFEVFGAACISNGTRAAIKSNMASGSLTIGSTAASYGGGDQWTANTAGLLMETQTNTEIAVHDAGTRIASLMYYEGETANRITIGRNMGWGAISKVVFAGAITPAAGNSETAGIMFPRDPFGGSGDAAWLRYYARSGEATTLELGISNDADDHIALMAAGGVGIGTNEPRTKLEVVGAVMERLDNIGVGGRNDWTAANHPIMQYFKTKLSGKPVGTYVKAIQDHPSWRGHYWQGWVDADSKIRVIHNYHNTTAVI